MASCRRRRSRTSSTSRPGWCRPQTVLTGVVPDQAALLGLLGWLQSLGLEVVEVRRVPGGGGDS